ncbi:SCO6745 family protein [Actinomycetospora chlora]|uniref:SCO6745 family protein n=1 Tax=Actinomycetospora chlora TaxID=663608 RepID=UPI0031F172F0
MDDARRLWTLFEPLHAVTYFTVEARTAADAAGLRGFWMAYTAQRIAPLGAVGPGVAYGCFHGFHRSRLERALPDAWDLADPQRCLTARSVGAGAALHRLLGETVAHGPGVAEAAALAGAAADAADVEGRVLGAANQALPRPSEPVRALWQAVTTLREHRGDGHVAALVGAGLGPVAAHRLKAAAGELSGATTRQARRFDEDAWAAGAAELRDRGWLDAADRLTDAGRAGHAAIEETTDRLAAGPWRVLGRERTDRLAELLEPLSAAVVAGHAFPPGNPVGLVRR